MCRIMDSIIWLYLKDIIQAEERDRLLKATEEYFAKEELEESNLNNQKGGRNENE